MPNNLSYWGGIEPSAAEYKGHQGLAGVGLEQYDNWKGRWSKSLADDRRIRNAQSMDAISGAGINPNRFSLKDSGILEQVLNTVNPISGLAGITKSFNRGFEKGTWDLAFKFPREMGSHGSVGKRIGEHFKSYYKDGSGDMRSIDVDINPLETVDTKMGWNPWSTTEALKKKGWDKLSTKAKVKLSRIRDKFVEEKNKVRYADEEEEILVKWNKKYQEVLLDEGFDSLSYPAVEGKQAGAKDWESLILFRDPTRTQNITGNVSDFNKAKKRKELNTFHSKMTNEIQDKVSDKLKRIASTTYKFDEGSIYMGSNGTNYTIIQKTLYKKNKNSPEVPAYIVKGADGEKTMLIEELMKPESIYSGPR